MIYYNSTHQRLYYILDYVMQDNICSYTQLTFSVNSKGVLIYERIKQTNIFYRKPMWFESYICVNDANIIDCSILRLIYTNISQKLDVLVNMEHCYLIYNEPIGKCIYLCVRNRQIISNTYNHAYTFRLYENEIYRMLSKQEQDNIIQLFTSKDASNIKLAEIILQI